MRIYPPPIEPMQKETKSIQKTIPICKCFKCEMKRKAREPITKPLTFWDKLKKIIK